MRAIPEIAKAASSLEIPDDVRQITNPDNRLDAVDAIARPVWQQVDALLRNPGHPASLSDVQTLLDEFDSSALRGTDVVGVKSLVSVRLSEPAPAATGKTLEKPDTTTEFEPSSMSASPTERFSTLW